jgi:hypothetical protein
MKRFILYIQIFIVPAILASCDTMVTNVKVPDVEPQLIVYSFLSPENQNIVVEVRRTMPIFKGSREGNDTVTNATVRIIQGGNQQLIPYTSKGQYRLPQSSFPLVPGLTYRIEVSTPQGERVTGTTTIPTSIVTIDSVNLSTQRGPFGFDLDLLQIRWIDNPAEKNYYQLYSAYTSASEDTLLNIPSFVSEIDNQVLSDELSRNNIMSATVQTSLGLSAGDTTLVDVVLAHTDEAYYRYHTLRLNYSGNNPFSEPTIMFNNVTGGVGVVASYRMYKRTIPFTR